MCLKCTKPTFKMVLKHSFVSLQNVTAQCAQLPWCWKCCSLLKNFTPSESITNPLCCQSVNTCLDPWFLELVRVIKTAEVIRKAKNSRPWLLSTYNKTEITTYWSHFAFKHNCRWPQSSQQMATELKGFQTLKLLRGWQPHPLCLGHEEAEPDTWISTHTVAALALVSWCCCLGSPALKTKVILMGMDKQGGTRFD